MSREQAIDIVSGYGNVGDYIAGEYVIEMLMDCAGPDEIREAVGTAVADMKERCAKVAEAYHGLPGPTDEIAAEIRGLK